MTLSDYKDIAEIFGYLSACWFTIVGVYKFIYLNIRRFFNKKSDKLAIRIERLAAKVNMLIKLNGDCIYVCDHLGKMYGYLTN